MKLTHHEKADEFLDIAFEPLCADEARNNLIVGIAAAVRDGRQYGDEAPLFVTVTEGPALVAAAIRTPPYNMILQCDDARPEALILIADHLLAIDHPLPGVNGTLETTEAFSRLWKERTGVTSIVGTQQRIYKLTDVSPPSPVPGLARWAEERDVSLLTTWFLDFHHEAVPQDPPLDPEKSVRRFIDRQQLLVWEDRALVSMVGCPRETPHGATIGPVYTPPEHRGRGYASACVAAMSQHLLDGGKAFCTLYTDLANPTSNKIYQNIGYRPVVDCAMVTFEGPADTH